MNTSSNQAKSEQLNGARLLLRALCDEGVEVVFGYPGGAIIPVYDAIIDSPIHHVLVRHEQGAAHMADGYARASGKVGVALATSGPGATNLVTGLATAMLDSSPIVCITGQVASSLLGSDAFQEVDITGITLPITKHSYLVRHADDIAPTIAEAFQIARAGRPGPVLVDITKDAQQAMASSPDRQARVSSTRSSRPTACQKEMARAAELIAAAERPLVLAGHGVLQAGASEALLALVERTEIPVASTLLGLGAFPGTHCGSLGMMGMHGGSWVNVAIQEADLLIALGMRFDDRVTGFLNTYAPFAKKIHADIDASEINKNVRVDVALVGDLSHTLPDLLSCVRPRRCHTWTERLDKLKKVAAVNDVLRMPSPDRLLAAHVIHDLWDLTEGKALMVTDVGQHQMWEAQYYPHDRPRQLITSGGLGTMGFALPAAIGARFARPDDDIWVVVGDGGFQMTAAELSTCAQEGIKINVALINNGYLGMVRQWQELFYEGRYSSTPLLSPDFVKLTEAHGLVGLRVVKRSEIPEAVERARASPGTTVIDFRVAGDENVYPIVPTGCSLAEMIAHPASTCREVHNQ